MATERNGREAHAAIARSVRSRAGHLAPAPRRKRRPSGVWAAWLACAAVGIVMVAAWLDLIRSHL